MSGQITMQTSNLGLAAFMKMKGCKLLSCDNREFVFTYDKRINMSDENYKLCNTISQWEVEYLNSCCREHDTTLMTLRKMITSK